MRIVHMTSVHRWDDTRIFQKMCRSLAKAGHDVHLVAPTERGFVSRLIDGVGIHGVPRLGGRLRRMTSLAWKVYRVSRRLNAKVYHLHDPELIPAGLALRAEGFRVVCDFHEDLPAEVFHKEWLPPMSRRPLSRSVDFFLRKTSPLFNALVFADHRTACRFKPFHPNITVVENYPDVLLFEDKRFDATSRFSERCVLNFGGVHPDRVLETVAAAIGLLPEGAVRRFVLGGPCVSPAFLKKMRSLRGASRMRYVGYVPFSEMVSLMAEGSASMVLYAPGPNNWEPRSNRLFESMAAGLPVITPNFPQWRRFINEIGCGLTVDPMDARGIAAAVLWLMEHPGDAAKMGARGRRAVKEKLNWENEEKKLLALYDQPALC